MHAVHLPRSVILSHKGSHGNTKGIDHHPEYGIQFAVGSPGRYRVGSKGIDSRLDDDIGQAVHHRLHPRRKSNADDAL